MRRRRLRRKPGAVLPQGNSATAVAFGQGCSRLWSTRTSACTSTHQVANDRFEVIVWIFNPSHLESTLDKERGKALMHGSKVMGQHVHHTLRGNHHTMDVVHVDDRLRQALSFAAMDVDSVWDAVELLTDAVHVPKGKHLTAQQHNLFGNAFNLTKMWLLTKTVRPIRPSSLTTFMMVVRAKGHIP